MTLLFVLFDSIKPVLLSFFCENTSEYPVRNFEFEFAFAFKLLAELFALLLLLKFALTLLRLLLLSLLLRLKWKFFLTEGVLKENELLLLISLYFSSSVEFLRSSSIPRNSNGSKTFSSLSKGKYFSCSLSFSLSHSSQSLMSSSLESSFLIAQFELLFSLINVSLSFNWR